MQIDIAKTAVELGKHAAKASAQVIREAIADHGEARIILSTGASQFETLDALVKEDLAWDKVTMFHLDEYKGLPESHGASFRKYLKERFTSLVPLKAAFFVNGEGNIENNIKELTAELRKAPIDLGLIGIGENAHIAFNDPPANLETKEAYIVVTLEERCKRQQMGEGWFKTIEDVPAQAISMTVYQMLQCRVVISSVPGLRKADAILKTLSHEATPYVPATYLKDHPDWRLYVDADSYSLVEKALRQTVKA